jgi:hypothetical protein
MAQRLRSLLGRKVLTAATGLGASLGLLVTALPLFGVPGYELASATALVAAVVGALAGILAGQLERASLLACGDPPRRLRALLFAFLAACAFPLTASIAPLLAAAARALVRTGCSPWLGLGFHALLPVPSALFASALGLACALATRRTRTAVLLALAAALASLVVSLWPLWSGPQIFALNHLFGYFPGPLYDEALTVDARLLAYRALTLFWTALLLFGTAVALDPRTARLRLARPGAADWAGLLALASALALFFAFDFELGLRTREADLDRALGGRRETAHFVLHFPRAKPALDQARLERDLELRWAQVTEFLGATPEGKVDAFFYRSAGEKRRLVGAAQTSFAKPWRRQLHVVDAPFPHPVARHELAHVVAGAFGSPFFRVSARAIADVNVGIVEGLAVAADSRPEELTLHQWAAAMRRLSLAPDIRAIVGPAGFYRQPPSRAYILAGSFLRYLVEAHGATALRALYPRGDFEAAFHQGLSALAQQWEAFLDAMPLDARALHAAQVQFERGSLFERPCAREVAQLREAADELRREDPERALSLYRRCARIDPSDLALARGESEILRGRGDLSGARSVWEAALARGDLSSGNRALALSELGDLAWEMNDEATARKSFAKVLALHRDRSSDRTACVKLEALDDAIRGPVLRRFFARAGDLPELLGLKDLAVEQRGDAVSRYLLGRTLLSRGAPGSALPYLDEAARLGLAERELAREDQRMRVQASYLSGDCDRATALALELALSSEPSDRAFAQDWRERCAFEQRAYGGALASER